MKQADLEQKVIELYEHVAIKSITPNEARQAFMKLINQHVAEVIGEDEGGWADLSDGSRVPTHDIRDYGRNNLRAEQRKRAGLC